VGGNRDHPGKTRIPNLKVLGKVSEAGQVIGWADRGLRRERVGMVINHSSPSAQIQRRQALEGVEDTSGPWGEAANWGGGGGGGGGGGKGWEPSKKREVT